MEHATSSSSLSTKTVQTSSEQASSSSVEQSSMSTDAEQTTIAGTLATGTQSSQTASGTLSTLDQTATPSFGTTSMEHATSSSSLSTNAAETSSEQASSSSVEQSSMSTDAEQTTFVSSLPTGIQSSQTVSGTVSSSEKTATPPFGSTSMEHATSSSSISTEATETSSEPASSSSVEQSSMSTDAEQTTFASTLPTGTQSSQTVSGTLSTLEQSTATLPISTGTKQVSSSPSKSAQEDVTRFEATSSTSTEGSRTPTDAEQTTFAATLATGTQSSQTASGTLSTLDQTATPSLFSTDVAEITSVPASSITTVEESSTSTNAEQATHSSTLPIATLSSPTVSTAFTKLGQTTSPLSWYTITEEATSTSSFSSGMKEMTTASVAYTSEEQSMTSTGSVQAALSKTSPIIARSTPAASATFSSLIPSTIPVPTSSTACFDRSNCTAILEYCYDEQLKEAMMKYCPMFCGYCTASSLATSSFPSTRQLSSTISISGIICYDRCNNCSPFLEYCRDERVKDVMMVECPLSCGFCSVPTSTTSSLLSRKLSSSTISISETSCYDRSDCSAFLEYCYSERVREEMKRHCSLSCGYCTVQSSSASVSPNPQLLSTTSTSEVMCYDKSDCSSLLEHCYDERFKGNMMTICARSCGYCTLESSTVSIVPSVTHPFSTISTSKTSCSDRSNCSLFVQFCSNQDLIDLMMSDCAMTCGFCTSQPSTTISTFLTAPHQICRDTSNCASFVDYCNTPALIDEFRTHCAKTCSFCTNQPVS
ncbi:unnamed protein product [Anisakis simplex]|uniref:ShKT domain-containing protein n=1 Tax=Anisakis simplex TaxID=6269 RepID=A0A0M3JV90_ANISI|nr:unnamed protein product [Anisakis simplex]